MYIADFSRSNPLFNVSKKRGVQVSKEVGQFTIDFREWNLREVEKVRVILLVRLFEFSPRALLRKRRLAVGCTVKNEALDEPHHYGFVAEFAPQLARHWEYGIVAAALVDAAQIRSVRETRN
jgi:hypothetical protein